MFTVIFFEGWSIYQDEVDGVDEMEEDLRLNRWNKSRCRIKKPIPIFQMPPVYVYYNINWRRRNLSDIKHMYKREINEIKVAIRYKDLLQFLKCLQYLFIVISEYII